MQAAAMVGWHWKCNFAGYSSNPEKESAMRKTVLILAGLMIVASALAGGTSVDKGTGAATGTGTTSTNAKTTTKASKWDHTSGEVTAVDANAKTLTVKAKAGDKTFKWDDKTVVTPKGSSPAVGNHVTVTTAKDSDMATKIAIRKAKPAPKPSPSPKA